MNQNNKTDQNKKIKNTKTYGSESQKGI